MWIDKGVKLAERPGDLDVQFGLVWISLVWFGLAQSLVNFCLLLAR